MKRKWIETGKDLLVIFNNHIMLIAFCFTMIGLFKYSNHMLWLWSVLLIVPVVFYAIRIKVKNFFLFFVLHVLFSAFFIAVPISIWIKILCLFVCVFYLIWSVRIRFESKDQGEIAFGPLLMMGTLAFLLIIETAFCHRGLEKVYIALAILFMAGYGIYIFLEHYLKFIYLNESSAANIPETQIFKNGLSQSLLCIGGMVTFLILTANVDILSRVASWIGDMLL